MTRRAQFGSSESNPNQAGWFQSGGYQAPSMAAPPKQTAEGRLSREPTTISNKVQILDPADLGWTSGVDIYWPWIIDAREVFDNPLGDYYCYYSLDHSTTDPTGIGLAFTDDLLGSWTDYASNPVIDFHTNGDETPAAVFDPDNNRLNVYYHTPDIGTGQSTGLATTAATGDGTSFSDQGVVLDAIPNYPGDNHTGYFRPHRFGGEWVGWSLSSGGDYPRFAVWYSTDGVDWSPDPRPLVNNSDITGDNDQRVEWNSGTVRRWNGELWWIGEVGPFVSGGDQGTKTVHFAPLVNERELGRRPRELIAPAASWEGSATYTPHWFVDKSVSRSYISYASNGSIGIAEVDGGVL